MKILYCNIGEMNNYNGSEDDTIIGGGKFNDANIGHEVNNYTNVNGQYYGYVHGTNETIDVSRFGDNSEFAEEILVIWVIKKKYIIGFYNNATVFRKLQELEPEYSKFRMYSDYNIISSDVVLIPKEERNFVINFKSRGNTWYGDDETNERVLKFVESYNHSITSYINNIEIEKCLEGKEINAVVKVRVNQSVFREKLIKKYNCKCCICGVNKEDILIASHIKPWSKSDKNEKVSNDNGFLFCPNHDKLFDLGFISFDEKGNIMISSELDDNNRTFLNVSRTMKISKQFISNDLLSFLDYHRSEVFKK